MPTSAVLAFVSVLSVLTPCHGTPNVCVNDGASSTLEDSAFESNANKVFDSVGSILDETLGALETFMLSCVSNVKEEELLTNVTFPYSIFPNWPERSSKVLASSRAFSLSYYPKVLASERKEWEAWAAQNDGWIDETLDHQRNDPEFKGTLVDEWSKPKGIAWFTGLLPEDSPGPHFPGWYDNPIVPVDYPWGWDAYSSFSKDIDYVENKIEVVLRQTVNLYNVSDSAQARQQKAVEAWIHSLLGSDVDGTEPFVATYYPVVSETIGSDLEKQEKVVGAFAAAIFWNQFLSSTLEAGSNDITVVFGNDCGQMFTYQISGPTASYVGRGDLHDKDFDSQVKFSYFHDLSKHSSEESKYTVPLTKTYCPYWMRLYPTKVCESATN